MKEHYVTYEQAVKLKDLGFDWPTSHYYCAFDNETDVRLWNVHPKQSQNAFRAPKDKVIADAPRLDQAQAWLRERGISVEPCCNMARQWNVSVCVFDGYGEVVWSKIALETYESALSAGIDAALELLTNPN